MSEKIGEIYNLLCKEVGDWWKDDRKKWCAYCGIPMKQRCAAGTTIPPQKATRDHVLPRKYKNPGITIPCCRACNQSKGHLSLEEFMATDYFRKIRKRKHRNKWPVRDLWAAMSIASLKCAMKARAVPAGSGSKSAKVVQLPKKAKKPLPPDKPLPVLRFVSGHN